MRKVYHLNISATMPMFDAMHRINPQPQNEEGALRYAKMMQENIGHTYAVRLVCSEEPD